MKRALLLTILLLTTAAAAHGWPFPPLCPPAPPCVDSCYVATSPKCQQVVDDTIANGDAVPCDDGGGPGYCAP